MRLTIKMLVVGLAMVPAGLVVTALGFLPDAMYPAGKFAGPALVLLGIVLIVMCIRDFMKSK